MTQRGIELNRGGKIVVALMVPVWILFSLLFITIGREDYARYAELTDGAFQAQEISGQLLALKIIKYGKPSLIGKKSGALLTVRVTGSAGPVGMEMPAMGSEVYFFVQGFSRFRLNALVDAYKQQPADAQLMILYDGASVSDHISRVREPLPARMHKEIYRIHSQYRGVDTALISAQDFARIHLYRGLLFFGFAIMMLVVAAITAVRLVQGKQPFTRITK